MGLDLVPKTCVQGMSASFICPDVILSASCLPLMAAVKFSLGEVFQRPSPPEGLRALLESSWVPGRERGLWFFVHGGHVVACLSCFLAAVEPWSLGVGQARFPGWARAYLSQPPAL